MGSETYFPGANDNASGTTMLISLAHYFKENRPDVNVAFIAFAGEEAGLLGSKYFVDHPSIPLNDIQFVLNLDIMGSGEEGITVVNATLHPEAFSTLTNINTVGNYLKAIKSRGPAANSDHYWFTQKKVPAFFIYTIGTNKHYHDVFDTYNELTFSTFNSLKAMLIDFSKTYLFKL
jgi:Zn-dependent M28 family amino/carboxypeptidase